MPSRSHAYVSYYLIATAIAASFVWPQVALAADAAVPEPAAAEVLARTRHTGWRIAEVIIAKLASQPERDSQSDDFPGIAAWLESYRELTKDLDRQTPAEKWPTLDAGQLVTHNPQFWRAYYEVAPGDAGMMALHSGLLLAGGEFSRALYVLTIARQLPNVSDDVQRSVNALAAYTQKAMDQLRGPVQEGIKRFDAGDYAGAVKHYRRQLAFWPQDGWAAYELGLALFYQQELAAGRQPPKLGSVQINRGLPTSPEVAACYARAREHDPFQFSAYQGSDPETVRIALAMFKECRPEWKRLSAGDAMVERQVLERFSAACEQAGVDELALVARAVVAARRGRYSPADQPVISASLRGLAPGPAIETTIKRLAEAEALKFKQLVVPERPKSSTGE